MGRCTGAIMADLPIRAMTKDEQHAFKIGENDFKQDLTADLTRHHLHSSELKDAYTRGYQLAIGTVEHENG